MPRKRKNDGPVAAPVPEIPSALLDQFVTGPMTAESVEAVMRKFNKAILEHALRAEMTHHLGYALGADKPSRRSSASTSATSPASTTRSLPCRRAARGCVRCRRT